VSSYNRDPLTEHSVIHHHDLRDGGLNEPAGGETAEEHKRDTPKKPLEEALRPSHVLGGEKNASAPTSGVVVRVGEGEGGGRAGLGRGGGGGEGGRGVEGRGR
jgi:hypothetical protein